MKTDQEWLKTIDAFEQLHRETLKLNAAIADCRRHVVAGMIDLENSMARKFDEAMYTIDTHRARLMMDYRRVKIEKQAAQFARRTP